MKGTIKLTIALSNHENFLPKVIQVRHLHTDPYWEIDFIELHESTDKAKIFKRYNCTNEMSFAAINGQAVVYGYSNISTFSSRLKGVSDVKVNGELI